MWQTEPLSSRHPSGTLAPPAEFPVLPRPPDAIPQALRMRRSRSATVSGPVRASALETIGGHAGCRALRRWRGSSQQRNERPDSDRQHRARGRTRNTGQDCPVTPTRASSSLRGSRPSCGIETCPMSRSRSRIYRAAPRSGDPVVLESTRYLQRSSRRPLRRNSRRVPQVHRLDEPGGASN